MNYKLSINMKKSSILALSFIICLLSFSPARANDGVYYMNGNQLVPLTETDITIAKEVLTISIGDDGYARVDVQYEFMNNGKAKEVQMGFEANAPYNDATAPLNKEGQHPYIHDFTVTMNGQRLHYTNAVVAFSYDGTDFQPLDLNKWKPDHNLDCHELKEEGTDSITPFSYAYLFKAHFEKGLNTVHHTYRYMMSFGIGRTFEIPYWLKPAMRWANHQIDDFTLRIKAENTAKHFCLDDSLFQSAPFRVTQGTGKVRYVMRYGDTKTVEVSLRNGTVEWHGRNFVPACNINISSADVLYEFSSDGMKLGTFYDRSEHFTLMFVDPKTVNKRILRNLPYAHRGYVFKSKELQKYFRQLWWYMPDPQWQPSTDDFKANEMKLIN